MKQIIYQFIQLGRIKMAYSQLIERNTIAGRSLVAVIAIMSFLASSALGCVFLINTASQQWTQNVSQELTVQIRPITGRNVDNDMHAVAAKLKAVEGVSAIKEITKEESDRLLEPWLGSGLNLIDLPIPRLVVAHINRPSSLNYNQLQTALHDVAPTASLDDHTHWNERLRVMSHTMVVVVMIIFILIVVAMILAVSFVTHGTMAENSEVINVLHYVGAENIYITKEFQTHFMALGLRGGLIGGLLCAFSFIIIDRSFEYWAHGPEGDQIAALLGQPALTFGGYLAIACVAISAGFLTAAVSRYIVMKHLNALW
jgi:cell division transport system permease protein